MGTEDSKCGKGLQRVMPAVAREILPTYFNMAASPSAVLAAVFADSDDPSSDEWEELDKSKSFLQARGEDMFSEKIELCLQAFDSLDLSEVNLEMFKKCIGRQIEASYRVFQSPTDPLRILLNTSVNCGTVLVDESRLWLEKIKGRMGGKVSIRHPYQCEIIRNLPKEFFLALRRGITHSRIQDIVNNFSLAENEKCYALSFTGKKAVVSLFSLLSGLFEGAVGSYFKRRVSNGKAAIIINPEKDFAFLYKVKAGQLVITFHYGFWNKSGFPLHS